MLFLSDAPFRIPLWGTVNRTRVSTELGLEDSCLLGGSLLSRASVVNGSAPKVPLSKNSADPICPFSNPPPVYIYMYVCVYVYVCVYMYVCR